MAHYTAEWEVQELEQPGLQIHYQKEETSGT